MGSLVGGILGIAGTGAQAAGSEAGRETTIEGAKTQARIESAKRKASQGEFERQIERQQPFLNVGTQALPLFANAISNRGQDVSGLPSTQIQSDLITQFLGEYHLPLRKADSEAYTG